MADEETVIAYAQKTFVALKNPFRSVDRVFPSAIEAFRRKSSAPVRYAGVKNRAQIPPRLLNRLREKGNYQLHTLDAASFGGRAVDISLKNPISGRPMTGSSSGTAINVLIGINDLGIGVDGGGSVLAPALSVNLFGFISPLIEKEYVAQFSKVSTDGIRFSPSIGFMAREYAELERAVRCALELPEPAGSPSVVLPAGTGEWLRRRIPGARCREAEYPDLAADRRTLLRFLGGQLGRCDVLLSREGPVDCAGFGDTVFGHFDERTAASQRRSGKGLVRVVNMAGATALAVPNGELACGLVLICRSEPEKIAGMLRLAEPLCVPQDSLAHSYFTRFSTYFPEEFGEPSYI